MVGQGNKNQTRAGTGSLQRFKSEFVPTKNRRRKMKELKREEVEKEIIEEIEFLKIELDEWSEHNEFHTFDDSMRYNISKILELEEELMLMLYLND